jgi:hypothetical protein
MSDEPTRETLQAASDAIDQACAAIDPEQAAAFDTRREQLRETLASGAGGLFRPGPDIVHVTYERAPTRDWNDVPAELQQRILDAVARGEAGETVDLGDFRQYLDDGEA